MPDNFYTTAERCLSAATVLASNATNQKHLSCYLSGYVAECAAKQIIIAVFSVPISEIKKGFGHKLDKLSEWTQYIALNPAGHSIPVADIPDFDSEASCILAKWDPFKRYSDNCGWDHACSTDFVREASNIMQKLARLRAAGII